MMLKGWRMVVFLLMLASFIVGFSFICCGKDDGGGDRDDDTDNDDAADDDTDDDTDDDVEPQKGACCVKTGVSAGCRFVTAYECGELGGLWLGEGTICEPETCQECDEPGQIEERGCGNCGTQTRECLEVGFWTSWSDCVNQGPCAPGDTQTQNCNDCGTQTRECQADCQWGDWSSCVGTRPCNGEATCNAQGYCVCDETGGGFLGNYGDCDSNIDAGTGRLDLGHSKVWSIHVEDELFGFCRVEPEFEVYDFEGDINIGVWYVCDDGAPLENFTCLQGQLVASGYPELCNSYPCCISNGGTIPERVKIDPQCDNFWGDDSGTAYLKVYRAGGYCGSYHVKVIEAK